MTNDTDMKSILAQNEALKKQLNEALKQFKWACDRLADVQRELVITKMLLICDVEGK